MWEILTAVDDTLVKAWQQFRSSLKGVGVHQGSILEVSCDAVTSPANSLSFMDGGSNTLYLDQFGPGIQLRVRQAIDAYQDGEVVVDAVRDRGGLPTMNDEVLTTHDREEHARALKAGDDLAAPVRITPVHSAPREDPAQTVAARRAIGTHDVVEVEITGDGYRHVAAVAALVENSRSPRWLPQRTQARLTP